jgi:hypothetical protein
MTIEQRLEQVEQQNQRIQRTNKRLTVALTMMAVTMCAVVTMAATGEKRVEFDTVTARSFYVENDAGAAVILMGANANGDGMLQTVSAKNKTLVLLNSNDGNGQIWTYNPNGEALVYLGPNVNGKGVVETWHPNGKTW